MTKERQIIDDFIKQEDWDGLEKYLRSEKEQSYREGGQDVRQAIIVPLAFLYLFYVLYNLKDHTNPMISIVATSFVGYLALDAASEGAISRAIAHPMETITDFFGSTTDDEDSDKTGLKMST